MIQAGSDYEVLKDYAFTIEFGKIKTDSAYIKRLFGLVSTFPPKVWEGDPDLILMDRMLESLPEEVKVIKYKPIKATLIY